MNDLEEQFRTSKLISTYLLDKTQPIDEDLQQWIDLDKKHEVFIDKMESETYLADQLKRYRQIDTANSWNKIKNHIQITSIRSIWIGRLKIAAAILGPVITISLFFLLYHSNKQASNEAIAKLIEPGCSQATLILSDGSKVVLNTDSSSFSDRDGTHIENKENILNYIRNNKDETEKLTYNSLVTPRGGEYTLVLSDGTRVWLNSSTTLKYPTKFSKEKREVFLEGEAYFEVTSNPHKPFEVITSSSTTHVLGTSFNIMCYSDEPTVQTTLVEGSIELTQIGSKNKPIKLTPGYQASILKMDNRIETYEVNTHDYTAWKDGVFIFNNENLASIMRKLSRWYNVNVVIEDNAVGEMRFFVKVKRYETIDKILDFIKYTKKVDYTIESNTIKIYKK